MSVNAPGLKGNAVSGSGWESFNVLKERAEQADAAKEAAEAESVVEKVDDTGDDFDVERLKTVYGKNEGESDEDYEKRLASMKEAAEQGTSKTEKATAEEEKVKANREAAEKLEKLFEARKARENKRLEERLGTIADIIGDGYQYNEDYKTAVTGQRAKSEAKINKLRASIDDAVRNGRAAELFEKLQNEDSLDAAFEKSQTEERDLPGTKVGELKAGAKEILKEYYARREEVIKEIRELEKQMKEVGADLAGMRGQMAGDRAKAKEDLSKILESIDAHNFSDESKDKLREKARERYEKKMQSIKVQYKKEAEDLELRYMEIEEALEAKRKKKDDLFEDMKSYNEDTKEALAEVRERFNKTISTPEEAARYEKFFDDRFEENKANFARTGRKLGGVVEGIVGSGETSDGAAAAASDTENNPGNTEGNPNDKEAADEKDDGASAGRKIPEMTDGKTKEEFFKEVEQWREAEFEDAKRAYEAEIERIEQQVARALGTDEPIEVDIGVDENGNVIGADKVDVGGLSEEDLAELNAAVDEEMDDIADKDLTDEEVKDKYEQAKYYVERVEIEDDTPVEVYIEQMKRVFAGEGLNKESWEFLEQSMRDRYDRVRTRQAEMAGKEPKPTSERVVGAGVNGPLDIEKGSDEYWKSTEGVRSLKERIEGFENPTDFIRKLKLEDIEGISIESIIDQVIKPRYTYMLENGELSTDKREYLIGKLNEVYGSYGLNADGTRETGADADKKRWTKRLGDKIRGWWSNRGRA